MSEEQAPSLRKQIDDKVIDARNEIIVQATNAVLLGRQVVLVSLGLTVLGVEQIQALLQPAVARGEVLDREARHRMTPNGANWQKGRLRIFRPGWQSWSIEYQA